MAGVPAEKGRSAYAINTDPERRTSSGPGEPAEILRGQPDGVLPKIRNVPILSFMESKEIRESLEGFVQLPLRDDR
jgi:hypothetical protein